MTKFSKKQLMGKFQEYINMLYKEHVLNSTETVAPEDPNSTWSHPAFTDHPTPLINTFFTRQERRALKRLRIIQED